MDPSTLHAWSRFFTDHPSEARYLARKFKYLRRMPLLALIDPPSVWPADKLVCPQSEEEAKMLKGGWPQTFLHAPLGQNHTYYGVASKFRLFRHLGFTTAQKAEVSTMAKNIVRGYGETNVRLRKTKFVLKTTHVEESLRHIMGWIGHADMQEMIATENSHFLRMVISERPDYWDDVAKLGEVYPLVIGTQEQVLAAVRAEPGLGQLAIGNPRFADKAELVAIWLSRFQYHQLSWTKGTKDPDIFHPKKMAIDITALPDKFLTKGRINSLGRMLKVYSRLTLITSSRVAQTLRDSFRVQRRALSSHEYEQQQVLDNKEAVTNDSGDVLQTNAGLH